MEVGHNRGSAAAMTTDLVPVQSFGALRVTLQLVDPSGTAYTQSSLPIVFADYSPQVRCGCIFSWVVGALD